jgi:GNAT superfamily N-acetyltransferase
VEKTVIAIRRTTPADTPIVARFVDALLVELSGTPSKYEQRLATAEHLFATKNDLFGLLASEAETPIALMTLCESAAIYAGGIFGVITELYVVPEKRSSGVAKMLVDAAAALGRERSWGRLEVGAPRQPAWERSFKFYHKSGFDEVGPRLRLMLSP